MKKKPFLFLFFCLALASSLSCRHKNDRYGEWTVYRGDAGSSAYSSLNQINRETVSRLKQVWTYHTGGAGKGHSSTIECNPIIVNGMMYVSSPRLVLIALNPATGKEIWRFDPFGGKEAGGVNRGATYWSSGSDKRIFFSAGPYLYALNADQGSLIMSFGDAGKIDLRNGLGRDPRELAVECSSPGIIYKDLIIQGSSVGEGYDAAPGFVRAYNAKTGATVWTFHTIPQPGEFGYDSWDKNAYKAVGGTNNWTGMCLDEEKGIVYIPLGSPAFDFYGANRKGNNLFGNSLLALDAATGTRKWHFQIVHHDLWDYDLPAPPSLVSIRKDGRPIEAVTQPTKTGMIFLFDRVTGEPVFPVRERPVPKSSLPGEQTSPTQPFPVLPAPFSRQRFSEADITDISPAAHDSVKAKIGRANMGDIFTPPDTGGIVEFPGTRGGAEWGGASVDPETGILYINANETPMLIKMRPLTADEGAPSALSPGEKIYTLNNCTMCHGADRAGSNSTPSLKNIASHLSEQQVSSLLSSGRGQMPSFPNISGAEKQALIGFLFDREKKPVVAKRLKPASGKKSTGAAEVVARDTAAPPLRYVHSGWTPLLDPDGYPGVKPPWGTLNAIDLNTGQLLWKVVLGEFPELTKAGIPPTGTPNLGGPVATAGGLLMIAATKDEKFRIFDKTNGKLLWEYKLPAGGYATPATYMVGGKQYIVIAAGGGGKVGSPSGDAYVAFALE